MAAVRVNLLPRAYRQARIQRRRVRICTSIGAVVLTAELICGLLLHARATETRGYLEAARVARIAAAEARTQLAEPAAKAEALRRDVALAQRLRINHYWSRLLAMMAANAPEKVTLCSISTSPPRWTRMTNTIADDVSAARPVSGRPVPKKKEEPEVRGQLEGVSIQGFAADYMDLSEFTVAINRSGAFASVNLREARRAPFLGQDAIAFHLEARW